MRISPLVLASFALLGCGEDSTSPPVATPPDVVIVANAATLGANAYAPSTLTFSLAAKQTVKWKNNDGVSPEHTVTADLGAFNSGPLGDTNTFSFTFTAPGTYDYHCTIHPTMVGPIIVTP